MNISALKNYRDHLQSKLDESAQALINSDFEVGGVKPLVMAIFGLSEEEFQNILGDHYGTEPIAQLIARIDAAITEAEKQSQSKAS